MSNLTIEMPKVLSARIKRGLTPASSQSWVVPKEDPATELTRAIGAWFTELGNSEALFRKHVYDNDNFNEGDRRQHCGRLCALIADGQALAVEITLLAQESDAINEVRPIIEAIDQKLKKLIAELFEWHGSLENQHDVPESFKQSAREVNGGKIVDLDI